MSRCSLGTMDRIGVTSRPICAKAPSSWQKSFWTSTTTSAAFSGSTFSSSVLNMAALLPEQEPQVDAVELVRLLELRPVPALGEEEPPDSGDVVAAPLSGLHPGERVVHRPPEQGESGDGVQVVFGYEVPLTDLHLLETQDLLRDLPVAGLRVDPEPRLHEVGRDVLRVLEQPLDALLDLLASRLGHRVERHGLQPLHHRRLGVEAAGRV